VLPTAIVYAAQQGMTEETAQLLENYSSCGPSDSVFAQARATSDARINPRFTQPSLGGGQAPATPLFGDAVSGGQQDPMAALMGGTAH